MHSAPLPPNENERLEALRQTGVLDTPPEASFDRLTELAAEICGAPIALVTLVDVNRQWFKSHVGLEIDETPRDVAFCAHAILQDDMLVVPDAARDERFADNPLVATDPKIRFYAGCPLVTHDGNALGTFCVIDTKPRELDAAQIEALEALSNHATRLLDLRRIRAMLEVHAREWERANAQGDLGARDEALRRLGEDYERMVAAHHESEGSVHQVEEKVRKVVPERLVTARQRERQVLPLLEDVVASTERLLEQLGPGHRLRFEVTRIRAAAQRAERVLGG